MPAKHHIDKNAKLIFTIWEGEAIDIDLIASLKKYQQDLQSNPEYFDYNEVVDFRQATGMKITTEGIKNISQLASTTDQNGRNRKLAFIVSSDLAFGLARMYEAYRGFAQKTNKEIRTFRRESDALDWVKK